MQEFPPQEFLIGKGYELFDPVDPGLLLQTAKVVHHSQGQTPAPGLGHHGFGALGVLGLAGVGPLRGGGDPSWAALAAG